MHRGLYTCWLTLVVCLATSYGEEPLSEAKQWRRELVAAIRANETEALGRILALNSLSPDAELNDNGLTPLMAASASGKIIVVRWLLDKGAKINAGTKEENGTALLAACTRGRFEVVKLLIERGADLNHKDNNGWSPLLGSIQTTNIQVAKHLVEHGADINATLSNGRSALMFCASEAGDAALLRLLIEKSATVNHTNKNGDHALLEAASEGKAETVQVLIKSGAQIDLKNRDGWTALLKSAALGHCDVVKALCDAGANPAITNKFGRTPLNYARGITGTNVIAKASDVLAATEKGIIHYDESYYVLARTGSGRDYDCVVKVLELRVTESRSGSDSDGK